jgi:hypothetical protein
LQVTYMCIYKNYWFIVVEIKIEINYSLSDNSENFLCN